MKTVPSAERVTQSYLARKPSNAELLTVQAGQEVTRRWVFIKAGTAIRGTLGREKVQVFSHPDRMIEDFANTTKDPKDILRFTQRYGVLHRADSEWFEIAPDERVQGDDFCIHCDQWLESQERMRTEWERTGKPDFLQAQGVGRQLAAPKSIAEHGVRTLVRPSRRGFQLELQPDDLLAALWLAFIRYSDRTRKCRNPTCVAPYFLASRRDQRFCNEKCARLVANRRWWSKEGPSWREARSKREGAR
jgi:hypothetical protein